MSSISLLPPDLTLAHRRQIQSQSIEATRRLRDIFSSDAPSCSEVKSCLDKGACFEDVLVSYPVLENEKDSLVDVWDWSMKVNRLDFFNLFLNADAAREIPDAQSPELLARVSAHADVRFLDALLAHNPPLNHRGFIGGSSLHFQSVPGIVGALLAGNDTSFDRLVAAGAQLDITLPEPPIASNEPAPLGGILPSTLLHFARTPHAVKRIVAAGIDVNTPNHSGHTLLNLLFDRFIFDRYNEKPKDNPFPGPQLSDMVEALLELGAIPEGHPKKPGWSVLRAALEADNDETLAMLYRRGFTWPLDEMPPSPSAALKLIRIGFDLPVAEKGVTWLVSWLTPSTTKANHVFGQFSSQNHLLKDLVSHGLNVNGIDDSTQLSPLIVALQNQERPLYFIADMVKAGLDLNVFSGRSTPMPKTWEELISEHVDSYFHTEMKSIHDPERHWIEKLESRNVNVMNSFVMDSFIDKEKDKALKVLGNAPDILAEVHRQYLDRKIAKATLKKPSRL